MPLVNGGLEPDKRDRRATRCPRRFEPSTDDAGTRASDGAYVRAVALASAPLAALLLPRGARMVRCGPERKSNGRVLLREGAFITIGGVGDLSVEPTQRL